MELSLKVLARFLTEDTGTTAIEYALIASAIFFAIVTVVQLIGGSLSNLFDQLATGITGVAG